MAEKVKSIIRQRKIAGKYEYNCYLGMRFNRTAKVISDDVIGEYDIDIPTLEEDEEFFLADIAQIVIIKKKLRSSDGSITYYVEDKIVETEEEKQRIEKMYNELRREFCTYKREYKYKNKFFNFGTDKAPDNKN